MNAKRIPYTQAAIRHLRTCDPVMARVIGQVGRFGLALRPERFQALVRAIMFQQLAGSAAQAIYGRFVGLFPGRFPTPEQVLAAGDEQLRTVGLSRQKILYVRDLARHVAEDAINFRRFPRMEDEQVIAELTRVRGIGRWTAEMFLMFNLGRPDVLPVDDLGFRKAVMTAYGLPKMPVAKELHALAERWRPYRTVAVWYLWQTARLRLPDGADPAAQLKLARRRRQPLD